MYFFVPRCPIRNVLLIILLTVYISIIYMYYTKKDIINEIETLTI